MAPTKDAAPELESYYVYYVVPYHSIIASWKYYVLHIGGAPDNLQQLLSYVIH